jgi:hypothetical protein
MKIVYHEKFLTPYPTAGVENPNRISAIYDALQPQQAALARCQGRRFAILEGGYYLPDLGKNCFAFLKGLA